MKNKLTANIGLKIISLVFAFLLWLVVNNAEDPTISKTFTNIPVRLQNTELITDSGKVYEVLDDTDVVERVTVRAPKSVFSSLDAGNIMAVADVSELSSLDTISIRFSTNIYNSEVESISGSIDMVKLNIEDRRTKTLALKATVSGTAETGYLVGDVVTDQNLVRISGPESVVNQVSKASVDVDVTGFTSDIGTSAEIRLYDAEDQLIQDSRITQNIRTVGVTVNIYQTAEIPINIVTTGTPASGYRLSGEITSSLSTVTIAGKSNVVRNVSSIEISGEALDISGENSDYVTKIDVRNYLPDNVFLADVSQSWIEVTVAIRPEVSRKLEISEESIRVDNVPSGYRATIAVAEAGLTIDVKGLSADVSGIRASDMQGIVDVEQWMAQRGMTEPVEGYYNVEVDFGLPDSISVTGAEVLMHLSRVEEQ